MSKINIGSFVDHNKNTLQLVIDEAEAILQSGQTGSHSDQARRNSLMASAILGILQIVKDSYVADKPAKAPVAK